MTVYHVGCGINGIYAGTIKKPGEWKTKSPVTDEVIAELEHDVAAWMDSYEVSRKTNARTESELRYQKYKRCLSMAWGCQQRMELFHELVLEEARRITLPNEKSLKEYRSRIERVAKWHKRWLEIAEKIKEEK